MAEARIVVSIRELESVKLLLFQLNELQHLMDQRSSPESEDLARILKRFTDIHIEDDRP